MQRRAFFSLIGATAALAALPATVRAALAPAAIAFGELYGKMGISGMTFSEKTRKLAGKPVSIRGYMAPPLKAESDFFVLTRLPVSVCPFCSSDADWPADIVAIYLQKADTFTHQGHPIEVTGILETGSRTDPSTGFVSQLRITGARWRTLGA